jgi:hypothetical protein
MTTSSELHLRRARTLSDPAAAMAEYMRAIEQAVRELRQAGPAGRPRRR